MNNKSDNFSFILFDVLFVFENQTKESD